jgi:carboxyl-terminal processing protease
MIATALAAGAAALLLQAPGVRALQILGLAPASAFMSEAASSAPGADGWRQGELDKMNKVLDLIEEKYMLPVDREKLLDGAIQGMMDALGDPFSVYLPEAEADQFADSLQGAFSGIGAELAVEHGQVVVVSPMKGSPAERAGLQPKDIIVSVNGQSLQGLSLNEAVSKIRGPKGTKAKLKIMRAGAQAPLELELVRDLIDLVTVRSELDADGVGRLWISQFTFDTPDKVAEEVAKLEAGGMKALVVDVRNNPGGVLPSVVSVAEQFIRAGKPIVLYEDRDGTRKTEWAQGKPGTGKPYPIVVLVNKGSASAAEILAGALKQSAGAVLVGETTYGKGTVQINYNEELGDGSLVKLTVSKWLLPDGTWIHQKGLAPDVAVPMPDYYTATRLPRDHTLRYDQTGEEVKNLQLILEGVGVPADRKDGYFSSGTEAAVRTFQQREKLPVTGAVDAATADRLEEALYRVLSDPDWDPQWREAKRQALTAAGEALAGPEPSGRASAAAPDAEGRNSTPLVEYKGG